MKRKYFVYKRKRYIIDCSKKVDSAGDLYAKKKIVYIDKNMPKKFHEGIAVHEIEERKLLVAGHSYGWSHNRAQELEEAFYEKKFGKGKQMLLEEDKCVNKLVSRYAKEDLEANKKGEARMYNLEHKED